MFLARRDRPGLASPKRELLGLLTEPKFRWLWTSDIINDYERSADAIEGGFHRQKISVRVQAVHNSCSFSLALFSGPIVAAFMT